MPLGMLDRIAGAPITWGVDGSPGWGYLMEPDRVLDEMAALGLTATELGPDGYLGGAPDEVVRRLERHGLQLVGGFIPVVLYDDGRIDEELAYFERAATTLVSGGATVAVLGPASHFPGYDREIQLDNTQWNSFLGNLDRLSEIAERLGVTVAVHPHWGMAVQGQEDVDLILDRSDVGFCLDTGHLALAEVDIVSLVARAGDRIRHVHLKDLDLDSALRVRSGETGFRQAVIDGMFRPLGEGGVDLASAVLALENSGFQGWYVLEQDVSLEGDPATGAGPIEEARRSIDFLRRLADRVSTSRESSQ